MIVLIKSYFREGRWSFYPGETFHAEAMFEERQISKERFQKHIDIGEAEVTEDADPVPGPLSDDLLLAVTGATAEAATAPAEEAGSQPLAEEPPPSTMTE